MVEVAKSPHFRTKIPGRYILTIASLVQPPSTSLTESRHEQLDLIDEVLAVHLVELELLEAGGEVLPLLVADHGGREEVAAGRLGDEDSGVTLGRVTNCHEPGAGRSDE